MRQRDIDRDRERQRDTERDTERDTQTERQSAWESTADALGSVSVLCSAFSLSLQLLSAQPSARLLGARLSRTPPDHTLAALTSEGHSSITHRMDARRLVRSTSSAPSISSLASAASSCSSISMSESAPGGLSRSTSSSNTVALADAGAAAGSGANGCAIIVAVRVRPPSTNELASQQATEVARVVDEHVISFDPPDAFGRDVRYQPRVPTHGNRKARVTGARATASHHARGCPRMLTGSCGERRRNLVGMPGPARSIGRRT